MQRQVEAAELALGVEDAFEEHDELELEKDHRVDAGPAPLGVVFDNPLVDEAQVAPGLQVPGDVIGGNEVLQRDGGQGVEPAGLGGSEPNAPSEPRKTPASPGTVMRLTGTSLNAAWNG